MKKVLGILLVALALLAFTGCGIVAPDCEIDDYYLYNNNSTLTPSSGTYSIDLGDAFSIYVAANTVLDGVYGSTIDYEGTLEVSCPSSAFSAYSSSYPLSLTFQGYTGLDYYADSGEATDGEERFYVVFDTVGTYTVTITLTNSDGVTDTETIDIDVTGTPVTSVSLNNSTLSVAVGATATLAETVYPSGASNSSVTWSSSDTSVATVSSTGTVTGVAAGTATITVTTDDGSFTDTCAVTVAAVSALPWSGKTVNTINYGSTYRGSVTSTSETWYKKSNGSSKYYIYFWDDEYQDSAAVGEIYVTAYADDGTQLTSTVSSYHDSGSTSATVTTGTNSYIYFKVECISTDTGAYFFQIYNSSTPKYTYLGTSYYTSSSYPSVGSASEVDLYRCTSSDGGALDLYFRDQTTSSTSYTGDVVASLWVEDEPMFYRYDNYTSGSYGHKTVSSTDISTSDDVYVFMESYGTSSSWFGTYNLSALR